MARSLTETQSLVLRTIMDKHICEEMTTQEIAQRCGIPVHVARRVAKQLVRLGKLQVRSVPGRGGPNLLFKSAQSVSKTEAEKPSWVSRFFRSIKGAMQPAA